MAVGREFIPYWPLEVVSIAVSGITSKVGRYNFNQIINEPNNTYYTPATGQTQAITDWTYNYDGRIYDITLDTGDKVSVEYGDQNITITENTVNEGGRR